MGFVGEQVASRPTSVIAVLLYTTPGRHADAGTVRAAIVAALDRSFAGVEAFRVTVDHRPVETTSVLAGGD
jgi:hypothetical protein